MSSLPRCDGSEYRPRSQPPQRLRRTYETRVIVFKLAPDRAADRTAASRRKGFIKLAVMMDDKTLVIDMSWEKIHGTSEVGIAEYILALMKGARGTQH